MFVLTLKILKILALKVKTFLILEILALKVKTFFNFGNLSSKTFLQTLIKTIKHNKYL